MTQLAERTSSTSGSDIAEVNDQAVDKEQLWDDAKRLLREGKPWNALPKKS
jgi:hypothetical protein